MRKGWEKKKLEECFRLKSGDNLTAKMMSANGLYPVFGGNGIAGMHNKYNLDGSNVIIGRVGALCGNVRHITEKIWLTDNAFKLVDFNYQFDNAFLTYLLNYLDLRSYARQAAQPVISNSSLKDVEIEFPKSLTEQKQIVAILDKAFAAIDRAKAIAEQNLRNARELFDSYLGRIFTKKTKDWIEKTLGEVCTLYQGIAINSKTRHALVEKSELPLLRIKDLKNDTVEQFIDPNNYPPNALVNESDIIYTRTGSLGLVFRGRKGILHNNSFKVVPNSELDSDFLFIWLQNPLFKSKILSLAMRAAQPDITHAIFKVQEIAIPPINEQRSIVQKLNLLSAQTQQLEIIYQQKIDNLEELKKSILQRAFAGELTAAPQTIPA